MKRWTVCCAGFKCHVEADTKEEAKKIAAERDSWFKPREGYRIIVKEDKNLYGWDLINSLGISKYD